MTGRLLDTLARALHELADTCTWLAVLTRVTP